MSTRALVIVGPDQVVKWSWIGEHPGILPGANLIFDGLAADPQGLTRVESWRIRLYSTAARRSARLTNWTKPTILAAWPTR